MAINADNDPRDRIEGFVKRAKLEHRILLQGNGVAMETFFVRGFPTKYWIGKDGVVVQRHYGGQPPAEIERIAQGLIK